MSLTEKLKQLHQLVEEVSYSPYKLEQAILALQEIVNAPPSLSLSQKLQRILQLIQEIRSIFIPPFTVRVYSHDTDWLCKRLEKLPNWSWIRWFPLDGNYYTVSLSDWKKIIDWDRTNLKPYVRDRYDCDKYALYFKANVARVFLINGVAWVLDYSAEHSYNIIFPEDSDPLVYEPQTDQLFSISDAQKQGYIMEDYYIVI